MVEGKIMDSRRAVRRRDSAYAVKIVFREKDLSVAGAPVPWEFWLSLDWHSCHLLEAVSAVPALFSSSLRLSLLLRLVNDLFVSGVSSHD